MCYYVVVEIDVICRQVTPKLLNDTTELLLEAKEDYKMNTNHVIKRYNLPYNVVTTIYIILTADSLLSQKTASLRAVYRE